MKSIDEMYTPEECTERIDLCLQHFSAMRVKVENRTETDEEREEPHVRCACQARARRDELLEQIANGCRFANGEVNQRA